MHYAVRIMNRGSSDEDLMLRYREGDITAFESLYERHRGPLFRYLFRQCSNRAQAEELFQDIWMKLILQDILDRLKRPHCRAWA